jgi:secreted trypsin-like serine protease
MLAVLTTALLLAVSCSEVHAATNRANASRSHATRRHSRHAHEAIVGGHFARTGQFPWLARVLARRGRVVDSCSGTVVATDLILTAGHCVEDVQTGITYGASEFEVRTAAAGQPNTRTSRVSRVLVYPGFERASGAGDVALLELSTPALAPPIQLAGEAEAWPSGTSALMAGWGRANGETQAPFLRWAHTVVQSPQWCASRLRGFHTRRQVCVMNAPSDNTAGCFGDSGGPLLVERGNTTIEIGVLDGSVVRGSRIITCLTTEPTVYANSSVISGWVQEWIQRLTFVPIAVTEDVSPMAPTIRAASSSASLDGSP